MRAESKDEMESDTTNPRRPGKAVRNARNKLTVGEAEDTHGRRAEKPENKLTRECRDAEHRDGQT